MIVIGAGPAGLGVAAELTSRGLSCTVLERGDVVGAAWTRRFDSLRLHTARWLSGSPGARIPPALGPWVSRDDYRNYLRYYARRRGVEVTFGVAVDRVVRVHGSWRLETSAGAMDADIVVVATGLCREPVIPAWPGRERYCGTFLHSDEYRTPTVLRGQRVLVVGAGNSGTEIAVDLLDVDARVSLSVRTPPSIVRRSVLGVPSQAVGYAVHRLPEPVLNPVLRLLRRTTVPDLRAYGLPAPRAPFTQFKRTGVIPVLDDGFVGAVRRGRLEIVAAVERFDGDDVVLSDGRRIRPDAVISATGYRPGLERLVGHLDVLDEHGLPLACGPFTVPGAAGLYFVGMSWTLSGLLNEIARQARHTAAAIEAGTVPAAPRRDLLSPQADIGHVG